VAVVPCTGNRSLVLLALSFFLFLFFLSLRIAPLDPDGSALPTQEIDLSSTRFSPLAGAPKKLTDRTKMRSR